MNKLKEKKQEPAAEAAPKAKGKNSPGPGVKLSRGLISVLNGSFLTRENVLGNMRFILFVAGLMLCYIAYGYWTERTVRELDRTSRELKEMRSEYITVRSHLEQAEQQSRVADGISGLGLKESRVPPRHIEVDKDELEASAR
ncbi:MAG TPA: FtsL-like putative cell division protein [Flavobacteriales bacterium]